MKISSPIFLSAYLSAILFFSIQISFAQIAQELPADIRQFDDPPLADINHGAVDSLSGICPANRYGEYWGVNDRGDASIFRFNQQGEVLQVVRFLEIQNNDWEAITRDSQGILYIGAFGDQAETRESYQIIALQEPHPEQNQVAPADIQVYTFRYQDNESRDCEAFFPLDGRIYLITRGSRGEDFDEQSRLYRIYGLISNTVLIAAEIGRFRFPALVTDAAYSPQFNTLIVLMYNYLAFFTIDSETDLLLTMPTYAQGDYGRSEALCFDREQVIITSQDGKLWVYPLPFLTGGQ